MTIGESFHVLVRLVLDLPCLWKGCLERYCDAGRGYDASVPKVRTGGAGRAACGSYELDTIYLFPF